MCRSVHRRQLFRQKRLTVARRESGVSGLKYRKIGEIKHEMTIEDLCRGYPPDFCDGLRYTRGLDFEQEPDYDSLRGRLLQALKGSNGLTEDEDMTGTSCLPWKTLSYLRRPHYASDREWSGLGLGGLSPSRPSLLVAAGRQLHGHSLRCSPGRFELV
ncbi:hypothetical protein BFJ66_g17662 [Fusarium oxysporum f. sp. cepae]|nr:hypothetical protein BFJ66_g17662 [Fusarium oxysporum f. sp. cepae]